MIDYVTGCDRINFINKKNKQTKWNLLILSIWEKQKLKTSTD